MFRSILVRPYAQYISSQVKKQAKNAVSDQKDLFKSLIDTAKDTNFGKDHGFDGIKNHKDFVKQVPIRDYEGLKPFIEMMISGEEDVLWPGKPKYYAKTSGTTSGVKYIPITHDSMPTHINMARNAMMNYVVKSGLYKVYDGKMMFLSGSPELDYTKGVPTGRLSGIVNHEIPGWIKNNQMPDFNTNCIEPWEDKVDEIVKLTAKQNMTLISGIPSWVQMYFERLLSFTRAQTVKEVFPNFNLFIYGGVNYQPYKQAITELIGEDIHNCELYPASEGFIAFQDSVEFDGMMLQTQAGIFYEFVPRDEIFNENPTRLTLEEVELGKDYALVLSSNAGLWAYNIGDTVRFTSLDPYKVVVSGRIKHYISAFGEHVIGKEVESAMVEVISKYAARVNEFTVAPQVNPNGSELPFHEWFVEFEDLPYDMDSFRSDLDKSMQRQNIYYLDLINGKILQPLKITALQKNAFRKYMQSKGKLGGQNKVPRLSNDRKIARDLLNYKLDI